MYLEIILSSHESYLPSDFTRKGLNQTSLIE